MRKLMIVTLSIIFMLFVTACGNNPSDSGQQQSDKKVKVIVSFDAMREFVQAVGKDKVEVSSLIPDGTEPHGFEPTTKNFKDLNHAQVFVYNGLGMEPWASAAVKAAGNKNLVVVKASQGISGITNTDPDEVKEHGQYDPHCWLSLKNAAVEVKNITDALVQADPENKDFYEANRDAYIAQLNTLYDTYAAKFQTVSKKQVVTGHAAFAYLCSDFGLQQHSVESVFADGEPSAQQLTKLIQYCKEHYVTTVFTEDMVSHKVSEALASEVGAKVETLYTMESSEGQKPYLDRMQENLEKIYVSLT